MKNVLVVFENKQHIESNTKKFVEMLSPEEIVSVQKCNNIIITNEGVVYKLIGAGFPYCYDLGDKLYGWKFDDVMIHADVVLTKKVDEYLKSRMTESKEPNNFVKEFIEFEL